MHTVDFGTAAVSGPELGRRVGRTYVADVLTQTDKGATRAVFQLFWIDVDPSEPTGWRGALAPEVELTAFGADRGAVDLLAGVDDRPYAVLGVGAAAVTAFELARTLSPVRAPTCLVVAGDVAPDAGEVSCLVVAFLPPGRAGDELAERWRSRSAADIAVRRLPRGDRFRNRPARETVLAVKEELRVWPN
jgi:hypothetical protein